MFWMFFLKIKNHQEIGDFFLYRIFINKNYYEESSKVD